MADLNDTVNDGPYSSVCYHGVIMTLSMMGLTHLYVIMVFIMTVNDGPYSSVCYHGVYNDTVNDGPYSSVCYHGVYNDSQ